MNFNHTGLKIAFAVEDYVNRTGLDDPNYVIWDVRIKKSLNNIVTVEPLKIHKCTDEDFDSFYPPSSSFKV